MTLGDTINGRLRVTAVILMMAVVVLNLGNSPKVSCYSVRTMEAYSKLPTHLRDMSITLQGALFERLAQLSDQSLGFATSPPEKTRGSHADYDYERRLLSSPSGGSDADEMWKVVWDVGARARQSQTAALTVTFGSSFEFS